MDKETSELIEKIEGTPMTTGAQIALAREIASKIPTSGKPQEFLDGHWDRSPIVQAALAAIQATTQADAELADSFDDGSGDGMGIQIRDAIRRGVHLHPHKEG